MPFIVDASIAGSWLLPMNTSPEALTALDRLKDDEAFVPALLRFELRNLLLAKGVDNASRPLQTAAALSVLHGSTPAR